MVNGREGDASTWFRFRCIVDDCNSWLRWCCELGQQLTDLVGQFGDVIGGAGSCHGGLGDPGGAYHRFQRLGAGLEYVEAKGRFHAPNYGISQKCGVRDRYNSCGILNFGDERVNGLRRSLRSLP
jgi:hypothetical protein